MTRPPGGASLWEGKGRVMLAMLHPGAWVEARRAAVGAWSGVRAWLGIGTSLVAVGVALACGGVGSIEWALERRADALVHLLSQGRPGEVADHLHYPESLSEAERSRDRASIQESLSFLLERFGTPESTQRMSHPARFDAIDIGAGNADYWRKQAADAETRQLVYRAQFQKVGPGVIVVSFVRLGEGWVVQSVGIGLDAGTADAHQRMAALSKELLATLSAPAQAGTKGQQPLPVDR